MAINGEAIHDTTPVYPFQDGDVYFTASTGNATTAPSLYLLIPGTTPDYAVSASHGSAVPTGNQVHAPRATPLSPLSPPPAFKRILRDVVGTTSTTSTGDSAAVNISVRDVDGCTLMVPAIRPTILKSPVAAVELLGKGKGAVTHQQTAAGLCLNYTAPTPAPFTCALFGCDCKKEAIYYNIDGGVSFGCAPLAAQHWWVQNQCDVLGPQPGPHPGCTGGTPLEMGVVFKLTFGA
jgi:hypothetical protein